MIDSIIELSLVSNMVAFLHGRSTHPFEVAYPTGSTFEIKGQPHSLILNQGHTSNGAAGTGFVLIGIGGLIAIWLQKRSMKQVRRGSNGTYDRVAADLYATQTGSTQPTTIFSAWVVCTILSVLLTFTALVYTFVVTGQSDGQSIDLAVAVQHPANEKYPLDDWAPQNWFSALNALPLVHESDHRKLSQQLRLMQGWRWNLIPLFIIGIVVACTAVWEWLRLRKSTPVNVVSAKEHHEGSQ